VLFRSRAKNKGNEPVLTAVGEIVKSVQQIIAAFVSIKTPKQRLDFRMQILAATLHTIVQVVGRPAERKSDEIRVCFASSEVECRVSRLVQTGSQMFDDFSGDHTPFNREAFSEFNLMDGVDPIGIGLGDTYTRIFIKKRSKSVESTSRCSFARSILSFALKKGSVVHATISPPPLTTPSGAVVFENWKALSGW